MGEMIEIMIGTLMAAMIGAADCDGNGKELIPQPLPVVLKLPNLALQFIGPFRQE